MVTLTVIITLCLAMAIFVGFFTAAVMFLANAVSKFVNKHFGSGSFNSRNLILNISQEMEGNSLNSKKNVSDKRVLKKDYTQIMIIKKS